jgi:hypothetical protein
MINELAELVTLITILTIMISVPSYYIYRIAKNNWVIDLKRWNLLAQFRQGRRNSDSENDS